MAVRHAERVTVLTADDLDELELTLGGGDLPSVVVEIPDRSLTLMSAREFRRVLAAARGAGAAISFATDDPLRRELARIVGAPLVEDTPEPAATMASVPGAEERAKTEDDATSRVIRPDDAAQPATGVEQPTWRIFQPHVVDVDESVNEPDDDASYSFVLTPPVSGQTTMTPRAPADDWRPEIPRFADWDRIAPIPVGEEPLRHARRRWRVALVLAIVVLLVLGGLGVAIAAPSATIVVTPLVTPIEATLTYGVAGPGTTLDLAIEPQPVERTLSFTATIPTTGERFVPDATASGVVRLTNATTEDVLVPAGAIFGGDSGATVVAATDVVVPAADPWAGTFGSETVAVNASLAGPDGNLAAQAIYGQLDSGIFYVNREPLAGGTNRRIAVVSQADVDALDRQARGALERDATGALVAQIPAGAQIVSGTEARTPITTRLDHQVGQDADALRIDASLSVTASIFDPAVAHERARDAVEQRLRGSLGDGGRLMDGTLTLGTPELLAGSSDAWLVRASARSEALLDQRALDALATDLTGASQADALARVSQVAGVDHATLDLRRSWLGDRLPRFASRIDITVQGAAGAEGVSSEAAPAGSETARP